MSISLVAAISQNSCIGKNGALPWDIPEDMKRVKELTVGRVVIMGRKTWESIPEKFRPLPKRTNVVITSQENYPLPDGVECFENVRHAIASHQGEDIVGFGGQRIFEDMIDLADTLEITHVHQTIDVCDAFFPPIDENVWQETARKDFNGFHFSTYSRIS